MPSLRCTPWLYCESFQQLGCCSSHTHWAQLRMAPGGASVCCMHLGSSLHSLLHVYQQVAATPVDPAAEPRPSSDVSDAKWFSIDALPSLKSEQRRCSAGTAAWCHRAWQCLLAGSPAAQALTSVLDSQS